MPIRCLRGVAAFSSFPKGLVSISIFRTSAFLKRSISLQHCCSSCRGFNLFAAGHLRAHSSATRQPWMLKRSLQHDNTWNAWPWCALHHALKPASQSGTFDMHHTASSGGLTSVLHRLKSSLSYSTSFTRKSILSVIWESSFGIVPEVVQLVIVMRTGSAVAVSLSG